ncbi:ubiquinone biosynthesis protein [Methylomagnum ishizawai]|uniref:Ubiquinone biosynthesis protein n=1 Tax=Methylomagnum ishizawai TaxID=1760988 RepID=A0A1Y6D304_9GAMM|nr:AarF/UbiB family protein [Methylomagnum ishizawai]SMF97328.1 ubiquinone biosynthesis protein [Methylomagnum ishizawai]
MRPTFIRVEKPKHKLLNPEYCPTPLLPPSQRPPIQVLALDQHHQYGILTVLFRFAGFGLDRLGDKLRGRSNPLRSAVAARELFQGLGGLWIKLGQLLSLRSDVLSDEMCDQLSQLLYANIGFPGSVVREAIERELGCPVEKIFSRFEDAPLAAASIAQVHRAVLRQEGVPVVVKLLRPNVIEAFRRDMSLLRMVVGFLTALLPVGHMRLNEALDELDAMVEEELDYAYEASNSRRLRKNLRRHKVYVPYLFRRYCTGKLLVMEEIQGVLMSEAIAVSKQDPERFDAWCEENAVEPRKVAQHLFLSNMRQLIEDNLFHGDMHPGNIILLRNNRYALIDFGTIGALDPDFLQIYFGVLQAANQRAYGKAADLSLHMCTEIPQFNIGKMRSELISAIKLWQARSGMETLGYHDRSLGASGKIMGQVFAKYQLQVSWAALRMARTWGTLDTSLAYFDPEMNHRRMFSRYLKAADQRRRKNAVKKIREGFMSTLQTANEYRVLLEPIAQRATIAYKQKLNKISMATTTVIRFLLIVTLLAIIFCVHAFLHQHFFDLGYLPGGELVDDFPSMEKEWFVVALFGLGLVTGLLRRLLRIASSAYLR